jgi:predicted CoA-binding protein
MHIDQLKRKWPHRPEDHRVVVLGASPKPARYSNRAVRLLKSKGYQVIPVHPKISVIEDLAVENDLATVSAPVHTLTLYVGPERSSLLSNSIIRLNPGRVIFNPGTESESLQAQLRSHHIECIHGCTLVMLNTSQF